MTYEEFKKELYRNLQSQGMSRGKQVLLLEKGGVFIREDAITMIRMINLGDYGREDTMLREDTICVVWKKQGIQGLLHWSIRPMYERFKREGWQGVLPEMVSKIQRTTVPAGMLPGWANDAVGGRLVIRPLADSCRREELKNSICWVFGDIALTLYLLVCDAGEELLAVEMNRDMVDGDVTDEVLLTNALLNTCAKMPPRLYYGTDIRHRYPREYGVFMPGERGKRIVIHPDDEQEGLHGYRVTTVNGQNGAVALFYPGVRERLSALLDGDYYVGFTSVNEAVVYPARHKALRELKAAIQRTNILYERNEVLSHRVYRYSCSRKELIEV